MSCWHCGNLNLVMVRDPLSIEPCFLGRCDVKRGFLPQEELTEFFMTWNDAEPVCFSNVEHTFSRHTMWLPFESRKYNIIRKTCACQYGRTHVGIILMMIIFYCMLFPTLSHWSFSLSHMNQFMDVQIDALGPQSSRRWSNVTKTFFQLGGSTITISIDLYIKSQQAFFVAVTTRCFLKCFLPKKIVFPRCFLEVGFIRPQNSAHVFVVPKTHHATV